MVVFLLVFLSVIPIEANTKVKATLSKCVDGDTTHFRIHAKEAKVRYLAIDTPEYTKEKEPYGKEASEFVCTLLTQAKQIEIEYDDGSDKQDKYGRTLAWVFADDVLVQAELVKRGLAEVTYLYGDYAYTDELKKLEKVAKQQQLNMWSGEEPEEEQLPYYVSAVGGLILILGGVFFTKSKRNKKRMIHEGIKHIRKS